MIKSFAHKGLELFFLTGNKAGIQPQHAQRIRLILAQLQQAQTIDDLRIPSLMASQKVVTPVKTGVHPFRNLLKTLVRRDREMLSVPHVRFRFRDTTAPCISNFLHSHPSDFLRDHHHCAFTNSRGIAKAIVQSPCRPTGASRFGLRLVMPRSWITRIITED